MQVIGEGAGGHLDRAARYYMQLASRGSTLADALRHLDETIESSRVALEECLSGHDAFDALAFLRLAAGPWDFADVRESESRVEASQSAQDVVALAFLALGLPRRPLTGENSGQPDIGKAMGYAAGIVTAAQTAALLRGQHLNEPLGYLAGKFLGYELSVRGRQYESIATEINTELLGDATAEAAMTTVLGFTLGEVRAVRTAAVALLNERFFGARDRVGDTVESGVGIDEIDVDAFRHDINLMMNECRLFGAVRVADVAERAQLDEATAEAVLRFFSVSRPIDGEPNPVTRFASGKLPAPWGCIADAGEYLMLNGFLGEDELRRDIERGLIAAAQAGGRTARAWTKYERRRAAFSEAKAATTVAAMLAGAEPRWAAQKYIGPDAVEDASLLGPESNPADLQSREFESDLLFVLDGVAVCVEVKAGSVTDKARGGSAKRLASDLEKTLKEGNEQADRLARLIRLNQGVWNAEGSWIDLAPVNEVHSIIVMLDDMGPLSLSMNELALKGIVETEEVPWIVSMHDLLVLSRTFDHAAQFLEYLRRRRGRKLATMVSGADELDLFMWFLNGGMYFEPDPRDVAAQVPIDRPINRSQQRRFDEQPRVQVGTLTDPLDAWFYGLEGLSRTQAPKPTRREAIWVEQYLTATESTKPPGWLRFGADLVDLSAAAQKQIGRDLQSQCQRARRGDRERSLTTHGTTSTGSWLLTAAAVPDGAVVDHLPEYMDAKQYQTKSSRSMLLLYRPDGTLFGCRYRGRPELPTSERDAEIAIAPLHSLAKTFDNSPSNARRSRKARRHRERTNNRRRR